MRELTRARAMLLAQVGVSGLALAAVGWWASRQQLPPLPSDASSIGLLLLAVAIYTVATALRCERWHRLLETTGVASRRADAYGLVAVGYMANNTLPLRAGDVLKAAMTAALTDAGAARVAGVALGERAFDAVALIALFVTAGALDASSGFVGATALLTAGGVATAVALTLAVVLTLARHTRAGAAARGQIAAAALPLRPLLAPRGVALLAVSLALWLFEACVYLIVGHAVGLGLGFVRSVEIVAVVNVVAILPAAPASLGTFDAAVLFATRGLASGGVSLIYVLALRLVLFVPITLVGLVVLVTRYGGLGRLRALRALPIQA